jgi:hypothetical protein
MAFTVTADQFIKAMGDPVADIQIALFYRQDRAIGKLGSYDYKAPSRGYTVRLYKSGLGEDYDLGAMHIHDLRRTTGKKN